MHFDGKMKNNRRKIERGLGILPYGNSTTQTIGKCGDFACVMTQAVLAKVVFGTPKGCAGCLKTIVLLLFVYPSIIMLKPYRRDR